MFYPEGEVYVRLLLIIWILLAIWVEEQRGGWRSQVPGRHLKAEIWWDRVEAPGCPGGGWFWSHAGVGQNTNRKWLGGPESRQGQGPSTQEGWRHRARGPLLKVGWRPGPGAHSPRGVRPGPKRGGDRSRVPGAHWGRIRAGTPKSDPADWA